MYLEQDARGSIYINVINQTLATVISTTAADMLKVQEDTVTKPASSDSEELVFHSNVVCDGCDGPVVGFRYNCAECINFDLCMGCEAKMIHCDHAMYRIPVPILVSVCGSHFVNIYRSKRMKRVIFIL